MQIISISFILYTDHWKEDEPVQKHRTGSSARRKWTNVDITTDILSMIVSWFAGGYGTIVGAGGGFILVPALLLLFNLSPAVAAGTGLVIVLINSLTGVVGYSRQKRIDYRTGLKIAIGAIPGSIFGVWLLQVQPNDSIY